MKPKNCQGCAPWSVHSFFVMKILEMDGLIQPEVSQNWYFKKNILRIKAHVFNLQKVFQSVFITALVHIYITICKVFVLI